jgi:hypothetical protein
MIYGVPLGNSSKEHVVPDRIWGQPDVTGQGDDVEGAEHQTGANYKNVYRGIRRTFNPNTEYQVTISDKQIISGSTT